MNNQQLIDNINLLADKLQATGALTRTEVVAVNVTISEIEQKLQKLVEIEEKELIPAIDPPKEIPLKEKLKEKYQK